MTTIIEVSKVGWTTEEPENKTITNQVSIATAVRLVRLSLRPRLGQLLSQVQQLILVEFPLLQQLFYSLPIFFRHLLELLCRL